MTMTTTPPRVTFETGDDLRRLASCRRDRVRFVEIPEKRYLAIDGTALPGSPAFIDSIGELFKVAYPLHFALRARGVRGHRHGEGHGDNIHNVRSDQFTPALRIA